MTTAVRSRRAVVALVALAALLGAAGCRSGGKHDGAKGPATSVTGPAGNADGGPGAGGATGTIGPSGGAGGAGTAAGQAGGPAGAGGTGDESTRSGTAPRGIGPIVGSPTDPGAGPPRPKGWRKLPAGPLRGRHGASAVWTTREMVVWGGAWRAGNASIWLDDGAAYDPAGDRWRPIAASPLSPREQHFAAWTGKEMLIWGGHPGVKAANGYNDFVDGALYDPAKNTWRPMADFPLAARWGARVVWTGQVLVVWGGARAEDPENAPRLADGAAYDPAKNQWKKLPAAPLSARLEPLAAAWNGSALISWGYGQENRPETSSALYDPARSAWRAAAAPPVAAPDICLVMGSCTGVDTGPRVVFTGEGLAWDPATDRWSPIAAGPFTDHLLDGAARAWTGTQVMAFGGGTYDGGDGPEPPPSNVRGDGAAYDAAADRWAPLPASPLAGRA